MRASSPTPRFKLNPIEVLILLVVCSGFSFSVYNVFRESDQFQFAALQPMKADPTRSITSPTSTSRLPASQGAPIEVPCSENPGFQLDGKTCPTAPSTPASSQ